MTFKQSGFVSIAVAIIVLFSGAATPAVAQTYDLVILNGRVMDPETQYDAVANVGIKDGKIAVITSENITGRETIDATGHVVAPGFIDQHFHWTRPMGYKLGLRDGVTTAMDLEIGALGTKVDEWYAMREGRTQLNYGTATAHELARSLILDGATGIDTPDAGKTRAAGTGWSSKKVNLEEGNKILAVIDEGLRAGAIGIGSTLGYMRDGVTAREMFEVQRVGALYGRQTGVHLRYTPGTATTEANGAQEIIANAMLLNAPAIICHFNNPGWQLVHELILRAREGGHNIWGEIYPYRAGSTALNAVFLEPRIWIDQLGYKYEDTLQDPATDTFFTPETYASEVKKDPTKIVIVYKMPEEDVVQWLRLPGVAMGSDGMPIPDESITWDTPYEELPNTHPRTAGAHGASLRIGREHKITLMQTLAQLSYNCARPLGDMGLEAMKVRGRMQKGMVADIVVFDPENVRDNSTYAKGAMPTTGIPYVVVNGVVVVKNSKVLKGVNPGQPIRFEPVAKGRFTPLSVEAWEKDYLGAPVDFCRPAGEGHSNRP